MSQLSQPAVVKFFFDCHKFGASNIWCFVMIFVSFLHSFCVKNQANEGKKVFIEF